MLEGNPICQGGIYALAHSLEFALDPEEENNQGPFESRLIMYGKKEIHEEEGLEIPRLYLIDNDSISQPCIAVPYNLHHKNPIDYIFLQSRENWNQHFFEIMKERT